MLCYGFRSLKSIGKKNFVKNYKYRKLLSSKSLKLSWGVRLNFNKRKLYICLPENWSLVIFSIKKNLKSYIDLYIYSSIYYFVYRLPTKLTMFNYDKFEKVLSLSSKYKDQFSILFYFFLKKVLYSFSQLFFRKIKFKGKGYYIYKNKRNTITPQFGYAHRIYVYAFSLNVSFLTKTKILMFGLNDLDIKNYSLQVYNIRPINIFTGRGMRFSKQVIYKKAGKISLYR